MIDIVGWGLLGTARINRRLIPAMRAARRSRVVAVASRREGHAAAYAHEWNIDVVHSSYEALLRDRRVDAVYIPLPNSLHVEWTLRALDAGKHVLCEKPLALTAEDVDRVAAVARARGLVVAEGFMYRHEALTARIVELLRSGRIGTPVFINAGFTYLQTREPDVRLDPALGGGSLWDVGCYAVNMARVVAGAEPISALGVATTRSGEEFGEGTGVDDSFTGVLRFPRELVASVHSSFRAEYRGWLEVTGSDGVLRVGNPFRPEAQESIELRQGGEWTRVQVGGSSLLFVRQVDDFVAAVLDGKPSAVSLADSRGNAAALAALYASARSGRSVAV